MRLALIWIAFIACGQAEKPVETSTAAAAPAAEPATGRDDATWKYFGEPFTVATSVPASAVLSNPEAHAGKPVRLTGELSEVCQKMGCWAVVRDDQGHSVRITMKEHAFGIDKDTKGRKVDCEGELVSKPVDPKQLEHFAEEGATEHPEAGKDVAWSLVVSSVAVARR